MTTPTVSILKPTRSFNPKYPKNNANEGGDNTGQPRVAVSPQQPHNRTESRQAAHPRVRAPQTQHIGVGKSSVTEATHQSRTTQGGILLWIMRLLGRTPKVRLSVEEKQELKRLKRERRDNNARKVEYHLYKEGLISKKELRQAEARRQAKRSQKK